MSVEKVLRVCCDKCRAEIVAGEFDDKIEARKYAREDYGMRTRVVKNGSKWDFCWKCHVEYEKKIQETD